MARAPDPKKAALWQGRFRRFLDSGLPVARFCAAEQVSESSFYYWQKKLGAQALRRPAGAQERGARAKDGDIRAADRAADGGARRAVTNQRSVFRPVTVVPPTCGLVIRLPGGARIELEATQPDIIRAVVAETVRADHGRSDDPAEHAHGARGLPAAR